MHAADEGVGVVQMLRMKSNSFCQKLPGKTLANGLRCHCSLEHQVVATPCKLAEMSSVTWQLIATRRLHRTTSPGVLACVIRGGDIALCVGCIEDPKMFENRNLIMRSQGPQGLRLTNQS